MTIAYDVQINREQLANALELFEFIGGNSEDALRIAINKAGPKVRTLVRRGIRTQVRLSVAYVNERLLFKRATRRRLEGVITTPSRGLRLIKFSTDSTLAGDASWFKPPADWVYRPGSFAPIFHVQVKPKGVTERVDGRPGMSRPFLLVGKSSRALLLVQRDKNDKLHTLYGPSLSQVFNSVRQDVLPSAGDELTRQMTDAIRYLTAKMRPAEGGLT